MHRVAAAVLACSLAVTAGCSTRPVVVGAKPLWPFEELEIRTSIGHVRGYMSRPEGPIERLIVTVQRSPCTSAPTSDREIVGTSGLLWRQFKDDSLFFQFERPGAASQANAPCEHASGDADADLLRIVVDAVSALRRHEAVDAAPASYVGVGRGAGVALLAAAKDEDATFVALVGASFDAATWTKVERGRLAKVAPVLIVHPAGDHRTSASHAEQLLKLLGAAGVPASMLIFEDAGFDFGLHAGRSHCLEIVADALGHRVRAKQPSADIVTTSCSPVEAPREPSGLQIEKISP